MLLSLLTTGSCNFVYLDNNHFFFHWKRLTIYYSCCSVTFLVGYRVIEFNNGIFGQKSRFIQVWLKSTDKVVRLLQCYFPCWLPGLFNNFIFRQQYHFYITFIKKRLRRYCVCFSIPFFVGCWNLKILYLRGNYSFIQVWLKTFNELQLLLWCYVPC